MGIKLILTENQLRTLDEQLSQEMREGSANLSCTDINYHELDQYLGNKNDRKIGFETIVHRVDDYEIAIKHYRTNILVVDATNIVTINTNGWKTKTTKDRLNQFLNCMRVGIAQKKGEWFIHGSNGSFPYEDGTEVHGGGYILTPSEKKAEQTNLKDKPHIYGDDSEIDPEQRDLYGLQ